MLAFVMVLLSLLIVINALEMKGNYVPCMGTWEIPTYVWEAHAPIPPADDTNVGCGTTLSLLDSTHVDEVLKTLECTLDSSKSYSKASEDEDLVIQYLNGDYEPPTNSPVVDAVWWIDVDLEGLETGPSYHPVEGMV